MEKQGAGIMAIQGQTNFRNIAFTLASTTARTIPAL